MATVWLTERFPMARTTTFELTDGTITVRTGVEGSASRAGHRLTLRFPDWAGTVQMTGGQAVSVTVRVGLASLEVLSGTGGVTPLTPVDKQVIKRNAAKTLDVAQFPDVTFSSTQIVDQQVTGDLTIHGTTRPITASIEVRHGRATASIPVRQKDFGVKPYSLMFGQLRVADEVIVDLDIEVPGS